MTTQLSGDFVRSVALLLILLNPFLLIIYLIDLVQEMNQQMFRKVLVRAGVISGTVFLLFGLLGDLVFEVVLQSRFASFQVFGGIIFLLIGIQFVFSGPGALRQMRGSPQHIAGSIAMPIMIGPGTVSASILAGNRLPPLLAGCSILLALAITIVTMLLLKGLHDYVRPRNESLIERYIEIMGRITALVVGTFAIEMIMQGLAEWLSHLTF